MSLYLIHDISWKTSCDTNVFVLGGLAILKPKLLLDIPWPIRTDIERMGGFSFKFSSVVAKADTGSIKE
jgi:hypothetical protein